MRLKKEDKVQCENCESIGFYHPLPLKDNDNTLVVPETALMQRISKCPVCKALVCYLCWFESGHTEIVIIESKQLPIRRFACPFCSNKNDL